MKVIATIVSGWIRSLVNTGAVISELVSGRVQVTALVITPPSGGGIPADAVLYEDGTQVFYEDAVYVQYVA